MGIVYEESKAFRTDSLWLCAHTVPVSLSFDAHQDDPTESYESQ